MNYSRARAKLLNAEDGMAKARMTSTGKVTIPKEVRERLGLRVGDEIEFTEKRGVLR
jgi:AbrB family looped-hinge helix DNA binding protein